MKIISIVILHTVGPNIFLTKKQSQLQIFVEILFPRSPAEQPPHGRESSSSLSAFYVEGTLLSVRDTAESKAQSLPFKASQLYLGCSCQDSSIMLCQVSGFVND